MTRHRTLASEDYLKQIYELSLDHALVKTSRLAEALEVSPAAVTEMVKRLDGQHLVEYRPYRGVNLTTRGRREALRVLRRHRLWEVFLFKVIRIPWPQVHDYACRLEHCTDDGLANALDEYLGGPAFDPHGDPIPRADGTVEEIDRLRLVALEPGTRARVAQCANENPRLLDYLKSLGVVPGVEIEVVEQAPFNGPLTLRVGDETAVIGLDAARTLIVQPL